MPGAMVGIMGVVGLLVGQSVQGSKRASSASSMLVVVLGVLGFGGSSSSQNKSQNINPKNGCKVFDHYHFPALFPSFGIGAIMS